MRYSPSGPVTAVRTPIEAEPVTVTVTPGITAFVLSDTVPMIAPVVELTWAVARGASRTSSQVARANTNTR